MLGPHAMVARLPLPHRVVLVVDEYASSASGLARLLRQDGFDVVVKVDVISALEWLRHAKRVDVVIVDLAEPDGRGYEVADMAREMWPGARVLAVSSYARLLERVAAPAVTLNKPLSYTAVRSAIEG